MLHREDLLVQYDDYAKIDNNRTAAYLFYISRVNYKYFLSTWINCFPILFGIYLCLSGINVQS